VAWVAGVLGALAFGSLIVGRVFLFEPYRIRSASMHPTIPEGSLIIVSKQGYGRYGALGFMPLRTKSTGRIARGDIVAFYPPEDEGVVHISRVMGEPGDRVALKGRQLSINGVEAAVDLQGGDDQYQYVTETIDGHSSRLALMPERYTRDVDLTVPPDHFYVLSDNRDNARDSRYLGFIPRENVVGMHVRTIAPGP
jgi:signal peptidase I